MKRALLIFFGLVLAICIFAFLGLLLSPRVRVAGVVGLGVVVILAIVWMSKGCASIVTTVSDRLIEQVEGGSRDRSF